MSRRRWIRPLVVTVVVLALFVALRRLFGLEFGPESIRATVERLGPWAPLAFVAIVAFRIPLGLPSAIVLIGGGLFFGGVAGTLYGAAGLMISALAVFAAARWGGREAVAARMPERFQGLLVVAGSPLGAALVAVGTAYPMSPVSIYHVLAGVTRMSVPVFLIAAGIGALGRAGIYTYFGNSLLEADARRILLASLLLLAAVLVPLAFQTPRSWLLAAISRRQEPL